jgi:diaminopimelate epimerase
MLLTFHKYQGTGNDFIIIDNREGEVHLETKQVAAMCHRRFGIGADGLMLLENAAGYDFKMVYYNSDGNLSSMCGNGGRCIASFATSLGLGQNGKVYFLAVDGPHEALVTNEHVELRMNDVHQIEAGDGFYVLNTGSPHYVRFVNDLQHLNIKEAGRAIRYNDRFKEEGINVNFLENKDEQIFIRTYERGVEDETYSCGTGVTAAAIVAAVTGSSTGRNTCVLQTPGGQLQVSFDRVLEQNFYNIWLKGPALPVFTGQIDPDHVYQG